MSQKFNAKAVAANLARYAAANREPTVAEQIASAEVWAEVEKMLADGFTLKDIAAGLVASGIEGKENAIRTMISKIKSERSAAMPATTGKPPEAVALDEAEAA